MRRQLFKDMEVANQGLCLVAISFLTLDTAHPAVADFRGCGGLTGADAAIGAANSGPSVVSSILRNGVGDYIITLSDNARFIQAVAVGIDDASDALIARNAAPSGEGAGGDNDMTMHVVVRAAASGTATESTGRRISVIALLKVSGNGA